MRFQLNDEYYSERARESRICLGSLPLSWEQRKVGELASDTYGGGTPSTSKDEFWTGTIPWIQSSDLTEHQVFGVTPRKYITKAAVLSSATKIVPENSLAIITRVGVGKLAIMPFSYTTSQDFLSLSKLRTDVNFTAYLLYKKLQSELNSVQGTSIKGITKDELLAKEVSVPDRKEQEAIGRYFRNLDNLITLHQRNDGLPNRTDKTLCYSKNLMLGNSVSWESLQNSTQRQNFQKYLSMLIWNLSLVLK